MHVSRTSISHACITDVYKPCMYHGRLSAMHVSRTSISHAYITGVYKTISHACICDWQTAKLGEKSVDSISPWFTSCPLAPAT